MPPNPELLNIPLPHHANEPLSNIQPSLPQRPTRNSNTSCPDPRPTERQNIALNPNIQHRIQGSQSQILSCRVIQVFGREPSNLTGYLYLRFSLENLPRAERRKRKGIYEPSRQRTNQSPPNRSRALLAPSHTDPRPSWKPWAWILPYSSAVCSSLAPLVNKSLFTWEMGDEESTYEAKFHFPPVATIIRPTL